MNYIIITDTSGNNIPKKYNDKNSIPFILLHTTQPQLLLEKISNNIWKPKRDNIQQILQINGFNPSNFALLGDIWYPKNKLPNKGSILLVNANNKVSQYPIDFKKILEYDDLYLWEPICPVGYQKLGCILSKNKPITNTIRVVKQKYIKSYTNSGKVANGLTKMNEYNLITFENDNKVTIKKINIQEKMNYSIQGELKMDDKIISGPTNDNISNNFAYLEEFDELDDQTWYPYSNYDNFQDKDSQIWNIEHLSSINKSFDGSHGIISKEIDEKSWKSLHGRNVVLQQSESPWYKEKELDHQKKLKDFSSDIYRPVMEYKYILRQQDGTPHVRTNEDNNCLENFEQKNDHETGYSFNLIAFSLLLIVIILILIKIYLNYRRSKNQKAN